MHESLDANLAGVNASKSVAKTEIIELDYLLIAWLYMTG